MPKLAVEWSPQVAINKGNNWPGARTMTHKPGQGPHETGTRRRDDELAKGLRGGELLEKRPTVLN